MGRCHSLGRHSLGRHALGRHSLGRYQVKLAELRRERAP